MKDIIVELHNNFFSYYRYLDIRVELPQVPESCTVNRLTTPHECRLRDLNYSAPINVTIEFVRNNERIIRNNVTIGK